MAKFLFLVSMQILLNIAKAQTIFTGQYHSYFGSTLKLNRDSTFLYAWHFDLESSWTKGIWKEKNDTIYLIVILVYDTLKNQQHANDSLVLSTDLKGEIITEGNLNILVSGGQNRMPSPKSLFYKDSKLFLIDEEGKLIRKKMKGFWQAHKKFPPWFERTER